MATLAIGKGMTTSASNLFVIVLGMHRSGTSAVTRGLKELGIDLGNNLMPGIIGNNDKGFWEDLDFINFNIELLQAIRQDWHTLSLTDLGDFEKFDLSEYKIKAVNLVRAKLNGNKLFGVKDPRIPRLLPFWKEIFGHLGIETRFVIMVRNPLSVADSLKKRDGFPLEKTYYLWLEHVVSSVVQTENSPAVFVDYDNLVNAPLAQLARIAQKLRLPEPDRRSNNLNEYANDFIDKYLQHTRYSPADLILDSSIPQAVKESFDLLHRAANDLIDLNYSDFYHFFHKLDRELISWKPAFRYIDRLEQTVADLTKSGQDQAGRLNNLNEAVEQKAAVIAELSRSRDLKDQELQKALYRLVQKEQELKQDLVQLNGLSDQIEKLNYLLLDQNDQITNLQHAVANRDEQITRMVNSFSWRVTKPLRSLRSLSVGSFRAKVRYLLPLKPFRLLKSGLGGLLGLSRPRESNQQKIELQAIGRSPLFDRHFYLACYPDVKNSKIDPARHYLLHGAKELRNPHFLFNTDYYLKTNPDVAQSNLNPLYHYITYGIKENRYPYPNTPCSFVRELYPEIAGLQPPGKPLTGDNQAGDSFIRNLTVLVLVDRRSVKNISNLLDKLSAHADWIHRVYLLAGREVTVDLAKYEKGFDLVRLDKEDPVFDLETIHSVSQTVRTDYLLVCHTDFIPFTGSLEAACSALTATDRIGAVTGRFVNKQGQLNSAGMIIGDGGQLIPYGYAEPVFNPNFSFRRDVDSCSPGFLLVDTRILTNAGRPEPAYRGAGFYSLADFSLGLQSRGYRMVFEPEAIILDTREAHPIDLLKQEMEACGQSFFRKHAETIKNYFAGKQSHILSARLNKAYRHRILIIDDRVPHPYLGAGYPRARKILNALHREGHFLSFYPILFTDDNWEKIYATVPKEVEVFVNYGPGCLPEFLKKTRGFYDFILVSRPSNMVLFQKAWETVKRSSDKTTIVYDAEALFTYRELMAENLKFTEELEKRKTKLLFKETSLANIADKIISVNDQEAAVFRKSGHKDVQVLGHTLDVCPTPNHFSQRKNILFVGALHMEYSPNIDSIKWIKEQLIARLRSILPLEINVIGFYQDNLIRNFRVPGINFLGKIDDLTEWYNRSRVFIAPTRFSAGIPLKIHEAAAHGLPVVATSLLARQLDWEPETDLLVGDRAEDFCRQCLRLYQDEALWNKLRANSLKKVEQDCSPEIFQSRLRSIIPPGGSNYLL